MAIISVRYDEGNKKKLGYVSVEITLRSGDKIVFNSGDFIKDWYQLKKNIIQKLSDTEDYFCHSSSIDHFFMDGAKFSSAYLHMVDDKPILKYLDKSDELWFINQKDICDGIEFFVPENKELTWEELKLYCDDNDNN